MAQTLMRRSAQLMRPGRLGATGTALSVEGVGMMRERTWW